MTTGRDAAQSRAEKETARVEAFSDGVFAIAVTLLVLELKVPREASGSGLGSRLLAQWPSYLALLTSFATIGIMWLNHHTLFNLIRRVDRTLLILNALVLLGATVVPFPTALVAAYLGHPGQNLAACVYSTTFLFVAIAFNALWRYASSARRQSPILRVAFDDASVKAIHAQYRFGPLLYVAALGLSAWNAGVGVAANLGLALYFAIAPRSLEAR